MSLYVPATISVPASEMHVTNHVTGSQLRVYTRSPILFCTYFHEFLTLRVLGIGRNTPE